jgi:Uma2 family endonuclease
VEEYLEMDEASEIPLEYHDGQIFPLFPIAEATFAHSVLPSRMCTALWGALNGRDCTVLASTLRVKAGTTYVYPDISVICGKPVFADKQETALNPLLIVEILSKSTEAHDRGAKFSYYRSLETLKEYALVVQTEPRIELYTRASDGVWTFRVFSGMDAFCHFSSLNCSIPLAAVYGDVPLAGPGSEAP